MGSVFNGLKNLIAPEQHNVSATNNGFRTSADQFGKYINSNTGDTGANRAMNWGTTNGQKMYNQAKNAGTSDGQKMYQNARDESKKETAGMADWLTQKQSSGAASEALGNMVSANMTRGRSANDSGKIAAAVANNFANNYNTQLNQQNALMNANLGQQNNMMNANLGQQNNMMNAYNQQLANQLNAQGTLMGANMQNDQAEYQQQWSNVANKQKEGLGLGALVGSDKRLKDAIKVGIDGNEDCRMARYRRAGEKLKRLNPNRIQELKWRNK